MIKVKEFDEWEFVGRGYGQNFEDWQKQNPGIKIIDITLVNAMRPENKYIITYKEND